MTDMWAKYDATTVAALAREFDSRQRARGPNSSGVEDHWTLERLATALEADAVCQLHVAVENAIGERSERGQETPEGPIPLLDLLHDLARLTPEGRQDRKVGLSRRTAARLCRCKGAEIDLQVKNLIRQQEIAVDWPPEARNEPEKLDAATAVLYSVHS